MPRLESVRCISQLHNRNKIGWQEKKDCNLRTSLYGLNCASHGVKVQQNVFATPCVYIKVDFTGLNNTSVY